ncbi:hypothetical protein ACFV3F_03590 [Streptomyces sp. NPDC059717]|uniref:hypothetical protein n=1 Tax=Streptomyces sp. NPDC059717 TaxID=3346922 RepID=UPI0036996D82
MAAMSRATRQIVVAHLTSRGMAPQQIASELGVSRDTVRRDMDAAPPEPPADAAPPATPDAPGLQLPDDPHLRQDLNLLAAQRQAPAEDVVRELISNAAEAVRTRWTARLPHVGRR